MREHAAEQTTAYAWSAVALGFFVRYPSPYAAHVLTVDTLERRIDPETLAVHTTRLLLKRGAVPRWVPRSVVSGRTDSWVLETSVVDVRRRTLESVTRNIDHRTVLDIVDHQVWTRAAREPSSTVTNVSATIVSRVGLDSFFSLGMSILRDRIEAFGLLKFQANTERVRPLALRASAHMTQARHGLALVLDTLNSTPAARRHILSGRPYRYPHHPVADAVAQWEEREAGFSGYGVDGAQPERYVDNIPAELRREPRDPWWAVSLIRYRRRQAELEGVEPPPPPMARLRAWAVRWSDRLGWRWRSRNDA